MIRIMRHILLGAALLALQLPCTASAADALGELAGLASASSMEADFVQETSISFLNASLVTSGKLCFSIPRKSSKGSSAVPGGRSASTPYVFWEYRNPEVSGIRYKNGSAVMWSSDRKALPAPQEIKALIEQLVLWFSGDIRRLSQYVTITPIPGKPAFYDIRPRTGTLSFASAVLGVSPDRKRLKSLYIKGNAGEELRFTFNSCRIDAPLSKDCGM